MALQDESLDYAEELGAVNDILAAIGEAPVNTLEGETGVDVANARKILTNVNREVQSKGWTFNIETGVTLSPDLLTGHIWYLQEYLRMTVGGGATIYIKRGDYVYDTSTRSDIFTGPIVVDLIRLRGFNQMPECFKAYIITKASRRFNTFFFGAGEVEGLLALNEEEQYRACMEYEMDFGQFNMLDGDAFVQGLLNR